MPPREDRTTSAPAFNPCGLSALPSPDDPAEIWKPITRVPGQYEVSTLGRVRPSPAKRSRRFVEVRRSQLNCDGYPVIGFFVGGKNVPFFVHRLVIEAFIGLVPEGMEINHKDGNKQNNRLDNLEIVSHLANVRHAVESGLLPQGERHYKTTLTADQVREIREIHAVGGRYEGGPTFASTARRFGVTESSIVRIVRRRTWKHLR